MIRIQPMPESKKIEDLKHYWSNCFHDNDYGKITNIALSHDEKFMFSAGGDSNIFGFLFNTDKSLLERMRNEKLRLVSTTPVAETVDIDDPNAYSIEEAKLKSETDKMIAVAEAKKLEMRQKIQQLRKTFKDLIVKNDQLVPRLKIDKNVRFRRE